MRTVARPYNTDYTTEQSVGQGHLQTASEDVFVCIVLMHTAQLLFAIIRCMNIDISDDDDDESQCSVLSHSP